VGLTPEQVQERTKKIKERYGEDFFKKSGSTGGKAKVPKGFAVNKELAKEAGRKGGLNAKKDRESQS
jgi:general stress protein YciG